MAAKTAALFERQLKVATAGLAPDVINAKLAKTARLALADAIAAGEAPNRYVRSVNGRIGAAEESVQAPGPIIYRFSYLEEAAFFALAFAEERSPVQSGLYKKSWFVLVDGKSWDMRSPIPLDAEVLVTNDQPYHRKVEVGAMKMRLPPHIAEDTRQAVIRNYRGAFTVQLKFINLAGGYILKGRRPKVDAAQNRKSSIYRKYTDYLKKGADANPMSFQQYGAYRAQRADTARGKPITYPAVSIILR